MGNSMFRKPNITKYKHTFWSMDNEDIEEIQKYKIIETIELDKYIINQIMLTDNYFDIHPTKSKVINNMLNYCLEHEEKEKFEKTDYICNKRIKVCINLKKILENNTEEKSISWVKKS
jgi:hypothetical protein